MRLIQTMRWFGPQDPVSLSDIRQAGATGVVTALHHIPNGRVWSLSEILARKTMIENAGLTWEVVESVPVHEAIKMGTAKSKYYINNYQVTITNLAKAGINTICYNFMPILDWTRTDLAYSMPNGGKALRFDIVALAAFDKYILKREGAEADYDTIVMERAQSYYASLSEDHINLLSRNIVAGLPGSEEGYSLKDFAAKIRAYADIDASVLRHNLSEFLKAVVPVAAEAGVHLVVHPDDPPFPIFGLPRVVSVADDIRDILKAMDHPANGICFCTGSFGARADNNLIEMAMEFKARTYFLHLRNVTLEGQKTFTEAAHLDGHVNLYEVVKIFHEDAQNRGISIPFRPDHGHQILGDLKVKTNPGYSAIGRLRGLAEIRGIIYTLSKSTEL